MQKNSSGSWEQCECHSLDQLSRCFYWQIPLRVAEGGTELDKHDGAEQRPLSAVSSTRNAPGLWSALWLVNQRWIYCR
jgi:hypothetical protein